MGEGKLRVGRELPGMPKSMATHFCQMLRGHAHGRGLPERQLGMAGLRYKPKLKAPSRSNERHGISEQICARTRVRPS